MSLGSRSLISNKLYNEKCIENIPKKIKRQKKKATQQLLKFKADHQIHSPNKSLKLIFYSSMSMYI